MKYLKSTLIICSLAAIFFNCKNEKEIIEIAKNKDNTLTQEAIKIIPITHGTLILETDSEVIYIDPTGGSEAFINQKPPTLVLITDIHGDHLSKSTLEALNLNDATLVAPKAVTDKLPNTVSKTVVTLNNGDNYKHNLTNIEAIPMYNLREEALKYHSKGRGNGYVISINDERIYVSGDTEDIPEMRSLKNIDKAFVCMNLPWTMQVESAASAVLDFKPKTVYPYHYRGAKGLSDIGKFKALVSKDNAPIEVILLDWY